MAGAREGSAKVRQGEKGFPPSGSTKDGKRQKDYPRRATKNGKGPLRGWRGLERGSPRVATGRKDFHQAGPRRTGKGKKISTKGHEGRQRATKGLEGAQEGSRQGNEGPRKGRQKKKRFPRRATKDGEGPLRRWRGERGLPNRQGEKGFPPSGSTKDGKRQKDFHEGPRRTAKGH